jgi:iron complex outermembrane receptor protein
MMNRTNAVALGLVLGSSLGIAAAQEAEAPVATEAAPAAAEAAPADPAATAEVGTVPVAEAASPEVAEPAADGKTKSRLIEEIIVTANRREENVKDVPISISAFSPEFLAAKGVQAQQDLPKVTPGLTVGQPVGFATTYIRGVGSDAFILADPLVVTYIDGVYFPASTTQFQEFGDVERIEIDKGPQGTLFGRNALGGVIAITSKSPSLTEVEGSARSGYTFYTGSSSSRGAWTASGFVSIPLITDTLAFSVSALRGQNDPYYSNYVGPVGDHRLVSAGDSNAYRFKVLFQPFDDLKVKLNYYRSFVNDPQRNIGIQTGPSVLGGSIGGQPLLLHPQNPYGRNDINDVPYSDDLTRNLSGTIEGHTPWMEVHLLGARQRILAQRNADFDGTDVPLAYFEDQDRPGDPYRRPFFSHGDSYELRFLTNESAPDWFQGVAGLYHYKQDSGVGGANFVGGATDLSLGVIGGVEVPGLQDLYNDVLAGVLNGLGIPTPTGVNLALRGGIGETAKAAYAQMTFKFTDWMSLTTGARYQETKRTVLYADQAIYVQGSDEPIFFQSNSGEDDPQ